MYDGSLYHGDIINAFQRAVPDCYVRDYRDKGGYIVICRGYRDLPWKDQTTTRQVYRQVPHVTLVNLPRGNMTAKTRYVGVRRDRPGWREEFRKASRFLTRNQMRQITKILHAGQVFPSEAA